MSSWGNLDNVQLSGNVVTATTGNTVTGYGGAVFTNNVNAGDYITIASNKYQVEKVISATVLYLTANAATNSDNVKAFVQQGPKFVANVANGNMGNVSIQDIYGIDKVEVGVPENKARGVASHTGWVHYTTYTGGHSQTRHKSEVLVALSKNFSANSTGALFGIGAGTDADDDSVAADYQLLFTLQPVDTSNTAGNSVVLIAAAETDPAGETINYQWSFSENTSNTTFVTVVDGNGISGNTTNTLTITNVSNVDGNVFRLTISGVGGADSVTSNAVEVTVV